MTPLFFSVILLVSKLKRHGVRADAENIENIFEVNEMEVRKASEFKSPDDMQGYFVYFKSDFNFDTPEGYNWSDIVKALEYLSDDECLVIPA